MAPITAPATSYASDDAKRVRVRTGAALTQGQVVCLNSSGVAVLARANSQTTIEVLGFCKQTQNVAGQYVEVQSDGTLMGLTGITVGEVYVLCDSVAGAIMPFSDVATGDWVVIIGVGKTSTSISLAIHNPGVQHA